MCGLGFGMVLGYFCMGFNRCIDRCCTVVEHGGGARGQSVLRIGSHGLFKTRAFMSRRPKIEGSCTNPYNEEPTVHLLILGFLAL